MDALAVYLNPKTNLFSKESRDNYFKIFSDSIATADHIPEGYQYCKHLTLDN